MYTATQAEPGVAGPAPAPLRLVRLEHAVFGPGGPFGGDDRIYFTDLMGSYDIACPPELFDRPRNAFTEMVESMVARLGPLARRLELAVLCGVTPDAQPGFPGGRLTDLIPGLALTFAVSDQGLVAPYTALDLLVRTARADRTRHAALFVLDQATLLHEEAVPRRLRVARDCAVALVLGEDGDLGTVRSLRTVAVPAGEVAARLAAVEADVRPDVVLCGAGLAPYRAADGAGLAPYRAADGVADGLPATGVWTALAAALTGWRGRRVLLADYDVEQQRLGGCTVDLAP